MTESNLENKHSPFKREHRLESESRVHVPVIDSNVLFNGGNEITIRHERALYRLRITKNGKLIMNK